MKKKENTLDSSREKKGLVTKLLANFNEIHQREIRKVIADCLISRAGQVSSIDIDETLHRISI